MNLFKKKPVPAYMTLSSNWREALQKGELTRFAHAAIDIQREYCDETRERGTAATDKLASDVADLSSEFRKVGIANYWVYMGSPLIRSRFYKVKPAKGERTFGKKDEDSAFKGSDIDGFLLKDGRRFLIVSGVNLSFCVCQTVLDACTQGYHVIVLKDLVANGVVDPSPSVEEAIEMMEDAGAEMVTSAEFMTLVHEGLENKDSSQKLATGYNAIMP